MAEGNPFSLRIDEEALRRAIKQRCDNFLSPMLAHQLTAELCEEIVHWMRGATAAPVQQLSSRKRRATDPATEDVASSETFTSNEAALSPAPSRSESSNGYERVLIDAADERGGAQEQQVQRAVKMEVAQEEAHWDHEAEEGDDAAVGGENDDRATHPAAVVDDVDSDDGILEISEPTGGRGGAAGDPPPNVTAEDMDDGTTNQSDYDSDVDITDDCEGKGSREERTRREGEAGASNGDSAETANGNPAPNLEQQGTERDVFQGLPDEWTQWYGEVVWCRWREGWWPACVFDPSIVSEEVSELVRPHAGNKHLVYYYPRDGFRAVSPGSIRLFHKHTPTKADRKIANFRRALHVAKVELTVPAPERAIWYVP